MNRRRPDPIRVALSRARARDELRLFQPEPGAAGVGPRARSQRRRECVARRSRRPATPPRTRARCSFPSLLGEGCPQVAAVSNLRPPTLPPTRSHPPPSTAVLIDVRCGRINVAGKAMAPDERKGKLRVCKATDGLCHLQWGSRAEGMPFVPEDDFIIFPQESVMKFIPKPGVFVIKFPDDVSRNMFFWSQEPAGRFDDETLTARVNAAPRRAPAAPRRPAARVHRRSGGDSAGAAGGEQRPAPRPDETPAATATVADTPAAPAKAKSDERSPAARSGGVRGGAARGAGEPRRRRPRRIGLRRRERDGGDALRDGRGTGSRRREGARPRSG